MRSQLIAQSRCPGRVLGQYKRWSLHARSAMSYDAETDMMVQLRARLKLDCRTKTATLAAAVAVASDQTLQPSQVCKSYGLVGA